MQACLLSKVPLGSRVFSLDDQRCFAEYSGDKNPIHLDNDYARTTPPGQVIVHGINALLWALDSFVAKYGEVYERINARFLQPIYLNELVSCAYVESDRLLEVSNSKIVFIRIKLDGDKCQGDHREQGVSLKPAAELQISDNDFSAIELIDRAEYFNVVDTKKSSFLYPNLASYLGGAQVSEVAYLSTVVGMQVPGLHSIFVSAAISLVKNNNDHFIQVLKTDRRFGIVDLLVQSSLAGAKLRAIVRPAPSTPLALPDIDKKISKRIASGKRVLIIGGSRGLGSNLVRLLVLMGAQVTFTYARGQREAALLKNELADNSLQVDIKPFDISNPNYTCLFSSDPEYVFYFATPKIFVKRSKMFEKELYNSFKLFYVDAFRDILNECKGGGVKKVFYPSTVAVDENPQDLVEYVKAKSEGESLSEDSKALYGVDVLVSRLPRTLTDQTATNLTIENKDPIDVMLPIVEEFFDGS